MIGTIVGALSALGIIELRHNDEKATHRHVDPDVLALADRKMSYSDWLDAELVEKVMQAREEKHRQFVAGWQKELGE